MICDNPNYQFYFPIDSKNEPAVVFTSTMILSGDRKEYLVHRHKHGNLFLCDSCHGAVELVKGDVPEFDQCTECKSMAPVTEEMCKQCESDTPAFTELVNCMVKGNP